MYKIFALLAVAGMMAFGASTVEAGQRHHVHHGYHGHGQLHLGNSYGPHLDLHQHRNGSFGLHFNPGHHYYYVPRYTPRYYYAPRYQYHHGHYDYRWHR